MLEPGAPFHIHFSDIAFANRNETKHLPYGEGTLRAEPLGEALARFERPATVISESPDEESSQAIRAALSAHVARRSSARRALEGGDLVDPLALRAGTEASRSSGSERKRAVLARSRISTASTQQRLGLLVAALRRAHERERRPASTPAS